MKDSGLGPRRVKLTDMNYFNILLPTVCSARRARSSNVYNFKCSERPMCWLFPSTNKGPASLETGKFAPVDLGGSRFDTGNRVRTYVASTCPSKWIVLVEIGYFFLLHIANF